MAPASFDDFKKSLSDLRGPIEPDESDLRASAEAFAAADEECVHEWFLSWGWAACRAAGLLPMGCRRPSRLICDPPACDRPAFRGRRMLR